MARITDKSHHKIAWIKHRFCSYVCCYLQQNNGQWPVVVTEKLSKPAVPKNTWCFDAVVIAVVAVVAVVAAIAAVDVHTVVFAVVAVVAVAIYCHRTSRRCLALMTRET